MSITISGYSDDIVSVHGDVSDEFDAYDKTLILQASTGHQIKALYDADGVWRLTLHDGPTEGITFDICATDDVEAEYSDVVTIDGPVEWLRLTETQS